MEKNYDIISEDLEQYYMVLSSSYKINKHNNQDLNQHGAITLEIEALLKEGKTWINAYKIERLLIPLYQDDQLDVELGRRIVDARENLSEGVFKYYKNNVKVTNSQEKQSLLGRLIVDLQGLEITTRIKQKDINTAWYLVIFIFIMSVVLYFLPELSEGFGEFLKAAGSGDSKAYYLYTAMAAGAMGAGFSMLIAFRRRLAATNLEYLTFARSSTELLVRWVTGWGAGLVLFYFLQSDFLSGPLFPDFVHLGVPPLDLTAEGQNALALLFIWCFISGFSEKFIPNLLSKTEKETS